MFQRILAVGALGVAQLGGPRYPPVGHQGYEIMQALHSYSFPEVSDGIPANDKQLLHQSEAMFIYTY